MRKKNKTGVIHLETWRSKRYVVLRNSNGSIKTYAKYSYKVKLQGYRNLYSKNKTFYENYKISELTNVNEHEIKIKKGERIKIPSKVNRQYALKVRLGDGRIIYARSKIGTGTRRQLKESAQQALYKRLSDDGQGRYDEDKGKRIFDAGNFNVSESLVWYTPRSRRHAEV